MAARPEGCRCDDSTAGRWYNRIRWLGPLYTAYRAGREFLERISRD